MGKSRLVAEFVRAVRAGGGSRRLRRMPVVRHELELLRVAGDLAAPLASTMPPTAGQQRPAHRGGAAAFDPGWSPARHCSRRSSGSSFPTTSSPRRSTPSSASVARGPPRQCLRGRAARSRSFSCSRTATGSTPLSRDLLEVARPRGGRDAGPHSCSPIGRSRAGRRPRPRAAAALHGVALASSTRTTPRSSSARSWRSSSARTARRPPPSSSSSRRDRRAIRSTSRSCSTSSTARASIPATRRARGPRASREPAQPGPEPRSTRWRSAAADAQGRERRRAVVPRADAARRLPGARHARRGGRGPRRAAVLDLVTLDREAEQAYLFKHVVTQEVAYESMPFAVRAMLHERVGASSRRRGRRDRPHLDLLAHHYWHSENSTKKREYLDRAGDAAQAALRERGRDRLPRAARAAGWRRMSGSTCS